MAINETVEKQVMELREIIIQMNKLNKIDSDFSDDNVAKSAKLGRRFNKLLKVLLASESGQSRLIEMLDDDVPAVRFIVARNLYPMFPSKTIEIMKNYLDQTNDKLEKMRIQDVIHGFESKQSVFMQQYLKKLVQKSFSSETEIERYFIEVLTKELFFAQ